MHVYLKIIVMSVRGDNILAKTHEYLHVQDVFIVLLLYIHVMAMSRLFRVSNPEPMAFVSHALSTALRGPVPRTDRPWCIYFISASPV